MLERAASNASCGIKISSSNLAGSPIIVVKLKEQTLEIEGK
jgi:hypothetical protein